jgi:hypothetical protein
MALSDANRRVLLNTIAAFQAQRTAGADADAAQATAVPTSAPPRRVPRVVLTCPNGEQSTVQQQVSCP